MLTRDEIIEILKDTGALLTGHFLLSSGLHSDRYIQCAKVLQYPDLAEKLCSQLAEKVRDFNPDLVIGPALGGVVAAYETARALNKPGIFAERKDGEMQIRRGFQINPGQRVLIVEDVVTTGGSVKEVLKKVKECGGEVVGVASLIDRSGGQANFEVPFKSLIALEVPVFKPEECSQCKEGIPVVKPGSRGQS
ncbi:MAG: orotate phosphoribosyltransferase [Clostridia bacterium]|jgi:orotate phosphoribosyltransferase|nr:orotate phosphoribosyltransferase [Clostridiales bacterium]MDK2985406.1 orotate phosphoribosyltransferase [Clostridia bacterium]